MTYHTDNDSSKMEVSSSRPFALWQKVVCGALLSTGLIYGGKSGVRLGHTPSANVLRGSTSKLEFVQSNTIICKIALAYTDTTNKLFLPQDLDLHDVQVGDVGSSFSAKPVDTKKFGPLSGTVIATSNEHGVTCAKVSGHVCYYFLFCNKITFKATICPKNKYATSGSPFGPQNNMHCEFLINSWQS